VTPYNTPLQTPVQKPLNVTLRTPFQTPKNNTDSITPIYNSQPLFKTPVPQINQNHGNRISKPMFSNPEENQQNQQKQQKIHPFFLQTVFSRLKFLIVNQDLEIAVVKISAAPT